MKKKYFAFLFSFLMLGCSDFLTVTPREEVSIDEQFSTLDGCKLALAGGYLKTEELVSSLHFIYNDLMGGNIVFSPNRTGSNAGLVAIPSEINLIYGFNEIAENPSLSSFYENSYSIVTNLNNIIRFTPLIKEDSKVINQIMSEALALRAFIHSILVKCYAQPYNFTSNASHVGIVYAEKILVGGIDYPSRITVKETYALIVKDFNEALKLGTNQSTLSGPKYSYLTLQNIHGLLARIYLESNDVEQSIFHSLQVVNSSNLKLTEKGNLLEEWARPNEPLSEVLFELSAPKDRSGAIVSSSVSSYYKLQKDNAGQPLDYGRYCASNDLLNLYQSNDVRRNLFINQSLNTKLDSITLKNYAFTLKHQDNAATSVMRLSELYLILSECYERKGDSDNATKYLNAIKERSGLVPISKTAKIIEEIFLERRRELCFEGHLFYDIARFKKNCIREIGCLATKCNLNYPNSRFILPIPKSTILVNQNMIQNEDY
jgi:starch-binding outer membrane protein, SusD/RagB family